MDFFRAIHGEISRGTFAKFTGRIYEEILEDHFQEFLKSMLEKTPDPWRNS